MSHYYVNCKPTTLSPRRGMVLVGQLMFAALRDAGVAGVGGLTFGADPVAFAAAFASELNGRPIKAFSIRKTQKDHGIVKWVEGDVGRGERVAIVDDVATTGGSTITAIERARSEGLEVVKAVVLVDRQEGGLDAIRSTCRMRPGSVTRDELMARGTKIPPWPVDPFTRWPGKNRSTGAPANGLTGQRSATDEGRAGIVGFPGAHAGDAGGSGPDPLLQLAGDVGGVCVCLGGGLGACEIGRSFRNLWSRVAMPPAGGS